MNDKSQEFLELMTFGGQLVYKIRTLLLKEEIDYLLGGYDAENNLLKEKRISQSVALNNMKASISANAVLLENELEKVKNLDKVANHVTKLWHQIKELSDYESFDYTKAFTEKVPYTFVTKNGEQMIGERKFYQKPENDQQIYMRWQDGRKKAKRYGYYKKNNNYSFFNDGWLYEWFSSYVNKYKQGYNKLARSLNKGSLSVMMQKMDSTAGYKGGDITISEGLIRHQIQVKFGNLRVISFKSIVKVLTTVKNSFEILYGEKQYSKKIKKEAIQELAQLFASDNNKKINQSAENVAIKKIKEIIKI